MEKDVKLLRSLLKKTEFFIGPRGYVGVSWKDLERYNQYEEPDSGFKLTQEDKSLTQLYAGLAVLSKDLKEYLFSYPREDAALFEEVVTMVGAVERKRYGAMAFPYDNPQFPYKIELAEFPKGLAVRQPKVNQLLNR